MLLSSFYFWCNLTLNFVEFQSIYPTCQWEYGFKVTQHSYIIINVSLYDHHCLFYEIKQLSVYIYIYNCCIFIMVLLISSDEFIVEIYIIRYQNVDSDLCSAFLLSLPDLILLPSVLVLFQESFLPLETKRVVPWCLIQRACFYLLTG